MTYKQVQPDKLRLFLIIFGCLQHHGVKRILPLICCTKLLNLGFNMPTLFSCCLFRGLASQYKKTTNTRLFPKSINFEEKRPLFDVINEKEFVQRSRT